MPVATLPTSHLLTWQFTGMNIAVTGSAALTDHRNVLKAMVDAWTGFGQGAMTVRGSSNSVTAAMDGANRWVAAANIVFANAGSAHSWIVLDMGEVEICIACDVTDASGRYLNSWMSYLGFTGGSTTARPTALDESPWLNQVYGTLGWLANDTSARTYRIHAYLNSTGTNMRTVIYSAGNVVAFMALDKLVSVTQGVTVPYVATWLSGSTSDRLTAAIYCYGNTPMFMRAAPVGFPVTVKPIFPSSGGAPEPVTMNAINPASGYWYTWDVPVEDATNASDLGTIPDFYVGSSGKTSADRYFPGNIVWQHFSDIVMPSNGVNPLTS